MSFRRRDVVTRLGRIGGESWGGRELVFRSSTGTFTSTHFIPKSESRTPIPEDATADTEITVSLWCNGDGEQESTILFCPPDGSKPLPFTLPYETYPAELPALLLLGITVSHPQYTTILAIMEANFAEAAAETFAAVVAQGDAAEAQGDAAEAQGDAADAARIALTAAVEAEISASEDSTATNLSNVTDAIAASDAQTSRASDAADEATVAAAKINDAAIMVADTDNPEWYEISPIDPDTIDEIEETVTVDGVDYVIGLYELNEV